MYVSYGLPRGPLPSLNSWRHCCGSASLWDGSGVPDPGCQFDADPDPTFHFNANPDLPFNFDADPDLDPSFQIKAQNLGKSAQIASYFIHSGLPSANWSGSGSSVSLWCGPGFTILLVGSNNVWIVPTRFPNGWKRAALSAQSPHRNRAHSQKEVISYFNR